LKSSFYTFKTPWFIKQIFPNYLWDKRVADEHKIYLTFDDGPTPIVTEKVLEILKKHQAKATFFLIGKNVLIYPDIVNKIQNDGHQIGNHTHNHLNGWKTDTDVYIDNILQAERILPQTRLFRPPYGKITKKQAEKVRDKGYQIVFWDILSGDFDPKSNVNIILKKVLKHTRNGSIVVFHDSVKAQEKMLEILPKLLIEWRKMNYEFELL
jgi:peptidoglycan/xylan/chitin deacetylase (PgdA/CDA1 family)